MKTNNKPRLLIAVIIIFVIVSNACTSVANSSEGTSSNSNYDTKNEASITEKMKSEIPEETDTMIGKFENKFGDYIFYRGNLNNTFNRLINEKELTIMYYGGSVTYGVGATSPENTSWRGLIGKWFKETFPDAKINNLNSSISGTGSKLGLYRLETDVLPYKPDLIFIEFAINDYFLKDSTSEIMIQNETMIRKLYEINPKIDIVYIYTENIISAVSKKILHAGSAPQDKIAEYYNLNSIAVGRALIDTISDKSSSKSKEWSRYYQDGVHPVDTGYKYYFEVIKEFLIGEYSLYSNKTATEKVLPNETKTVTMKRYELIHGSKLQNAVSGDWKYHKENIISSGLAKYDGYLNTDSSGKEMVFTFHGKGLSLFFAGSGVGNLQYSVDSPGWKSVTSDGNRPLTLLFDEGEPEEHIIKIRFKNSEKTFDFKVVGLLVWYE